MSFINNFLFHFHDKSINQILDQKNYEEFFKYLKRLKSKDEIFHHLSLNYIPQVMRDYKEDVHENKIIWINSFDKDDASYLINFFNYYNQKISNYPKTINSYEEEISKITKSFKEIDLNTLVNFSYFFQWMFLNYSISSSKFIINNIPFFSSENNNNFSSQSFTRSYIHIVNDPYEIYKKLKSNIQDQQLAKNILLNLDQKANEQTIANVKFKINKQGWHTFCKSWNDENVINSLRGLIVKKSALVENPYEILIEILMHLVQSGLSIDIKHDLIESYVNLHPPEKDHFNVDLSKKELKFINNYIDGSDFE